MLNCADYQILTVTLYLTPHVMLKRNERMIGTKGNMPNGYCLIGLGDNV